MRLEAFGGWGQWALQGLRVRTDERSPAWIAWLLLALALVGTVVWLILAWPFRRGAARRLLDRLDAAGVWPEAALWAAAVVLALLLVLGRHIAVDLAALVMLGLLFLVRPDLSLPLIAASLPFWQRPEQLLRWQFPHFLIFLWLGVLALGARRVIEVVARPQAVSAPTEGPGYRGGFTLHASRSTSLVPRLARARPPRQRPALDDLCAEQRRGGAGILHGFPGRRAVLLADHADALARRPRLHAHAAAERLPGRHGGCEPDRTVAACHRPGPHRRGGGLARAVRSTARRTTWRWSWIGRSRWHWRWRCSGGRDSSGRSCGIGLRRS